MKEKNLKVLETINDRFLYFLIFGLYVAPYISILF